MIALVTFADLILAIMTSATVLAFVLGFILGRRL